MFLFYLKSLDFEQLQSSENIRQKFSVKMVFGKVRAYYYISFKNYYNQEKIVSIKEEEDTLWFW